MKPTEPNPETLLRGTEQRDEDSTATALQSLVQDLMKQLETANKTILELGMKGAALQKELDMHKEFEKLNVNHAVALAKADWEHQTHQLEELAALAGRA